MFATDFMFDGQLASDFDMVICSFDGDFTVASGGETEFNVVKAPDRDRFTFYGADLPNTLVWTFGIMKNPCKYANDLYLTYDEERSIAKWLLKKDGYHWFRFIQDEEEDIYYKVQINMNPQQYGGRTVGFNLTITSDCAYGFSSLIKKSITVNSSAPAKILVDSDVDSYILPKVTVTGSGDFYLSNESDPTQNVSTGKVTQLQNMSSGAAITMDSDNGIITGLKDTGDFSWYFFRLVDGMNVITTNASNDVKLIFWYREPRRVIV